jgi:hypothetical protein
MRWRPAADMVLHVENAASLDRAPYGLIGLFAVVRFKQ